MPVGAGIIYLWKVNTWGLPWEIPITEHAHPLSGARRCPTFLTSHWVVLPDLSWEVLTPPSRAVSFRIVSTIPHISHHLDLSPLWFPRRCGCCVGPPHLLCFWILPSCPIPLLHILLDHYVLWFAVVTWASAQCRFFFLFRLKSCKKLFGYRAWWRITWSFYCVNQNPVSYF